MPPTRFLVPIPALCVAAALCGCGDGLPPLMEVNGTVTFNDAPLRGAVVEFRPVATDVRGGVGRTDSEGKYELVFTGGKKGTPAGKYKVIITTTVNPKTREERPEQLPWKYSDPDESELTAEVTENGQTIDFTLAGKAPKPKKTPKNKRDDSD